MKTENVKETTEKVQKDLQRLSHGEVTVNQIRNKYGLLPIKDGDLFNRKEKENDYR